MQARESASSNTASTFRANCEKPAADDDAKLIVSFPAEEDLALLSRLAPAISDYSRNSQLDEASGSSCPKNEIS